MLKIPIVVVAYNRVDSLKRLLFSLKQANYSHKVDLIISIDYSEEYNKDIIKLSEDFRWENGKKEIITYNKNLGLKNHIIECGNLSLNYDGIIILEDDLYVSPVFYDFTIQCVNFYHKDEKIAGYSLYSHQYNETAHLPFNPIHDRSDVFFMQLVSSWGQVWENHHWNDFIKGYTNSNMPLTGIDNIPENVINWSETSWKKYYIKYMITHNKYFVYPRISLITNLLESGVHYKHKEFHLNLPFQMESKKYNFSKLYNTYAIYDAYCEILPEALNKLYQKLHNYNYSVDLYGMKNLNKINSDYLLTSKSSQRSIYSYGKELKPHECNIIKEITGNNIFFLEKKYCVNENFDNLQKKSNNIFEILYYYPIREFQLEYNNITQKYRIENQKLRIENQNIKNSMKYKIGKFLLFPLLLIKKYFFRKRNNDK